MTSSSAQASGDQAVAGLVDGLVVQGQHQSLGAEQLAQRAVRAE